MSYATQQAAAAARIVKRAARRERYEGMKRMLDAGATLTEVGREFGVTYQRVAQFLAAWGPEFSDRKADAA